MQDILALTACVIIIAGCWKLLTTQKRKLKFRVYPKGPDINLNSGQCQNIAINNFLHVRGLTTKLEVKKLIKMPVIRGIRTPLVDECRIAPLENNFEIKVTFTTGFHEFLEIYDTSQIES